MAADLARTHVYDYPRAWRSGAVALRIVREVENATIVFVVCDRGDRYLSTGVFPA